MVKSFLKKWWNDLKYEPGDPRQLAGGRIKIAAIGGGTGLATLLRGLKNYSNDISAIVSVTDNGTSTGVLRKEFDILAPGDIRKCISALAYDEELISSIFEYRFDKDGNSFAGHTLGNIWITGLTKYLGSFDKAIEMTSEIFKTAGRVLPSTLDDADIKIEYEDGNTLIGEEHLDEQLKKIKKISLSRSAKGYKKSISAISDADLILIGPGSLYGSILPNLLIKDLSEAIAKNKKAVKIYIANGSTERTQTRDYTVEDHIQAIFDHVPEKLFDYSLVNNKIVSRSEDQTKLGEVNNITTEKDEYKGIKLIKEDLINEESPLYHDSNKLAKAVVELYNSAKAHKN